MALSGRISEHASAKLQELLQELSEVKVVHFDLRDVSGINSVGVREWIVFIDRCVERADSVELHQCSTAFVSQLNMVAGFDGGAAVRSMMLPFICEACGAETEIAVEVEAGSRPVYAAPPCTVHETPMSFDDLEDAYFAFLERT